MTRWLLAAAIVALCACSERPILNLPEEAGAPARLVPSSVHVIEIAEPLDLLHAKGEAGEATLSQDGRTCVVLVPKEADIADRARILTHEYRHCAGQSHYVERKPDGSYLIVWRP
jgi:hypothetical protein